MPTRFQLACGPSQSGSRSNYPAHACCPLSARCASYCPLPLLSDYKAQAYSAKHPSCVEKWLTEPTALAVTFDKAGEKRVPCDVDLWTNPTITDYYIVRAQFGGDHNPPALAEVAPKVASPRSPRKLKGESDGTLDESLPSKPSPDHDSASLNGHSLRGEGNPVGAQCAAEPQIPDKDMEATARAAALLQRYDDRKAIIGAQKATQVQALLHDGHAEAALQLVEAALGDCFSRRVKNHCNGDGRELCISLCFSRAVALNAIGQVNEAESTYRTTLALCEASDIRRRVVSHNLVLLLAARGDMEAALAAAHQTAKMCNDADSWYEYATLASCTNRRDVAVRAYQSALRVHPKHAPSIINLVYNLEKDPLRGPAAATAVARSAISRSVVWSNPLQRPQFWFPGLSAKPWWDAAKFWFSDLLRANFAEIRREWEAQRASFGAEVGDRAGFAHDGTLKLRGSWREHVFFSNGTRVEKTARRFPKTAALLNRIPDAVAAAQVGCGETLFSTLAPGTVLRPHCGSTNARLTLHFGVVIPEGDITIRCGTESRKWIEGDSIVFDDSFEHEVIHNGNQPRTVLLVNFWHPEFQEHRTDTAWRRRAHHGTVLDSYCHGASA